MKGSLKIARLAGIDVYLHVTFLLLLAWLALSDLFAGNGLRAMAESVLMTVLVFAIIVLHELGHALAARRYGIRTERITLLPIGGVASMERIPEDPRQELVVALAGPAVNVALAALAFLLVAAGAGLGTLGHFGELLPRLFWTNVVLAVFNMVPAFPMDGGRVLRAILSLSMDRVRATRIAATLGQIIAILFGILGLAVNPMLLLVALFVWVGAKSEADDVGFKAAVRDVRVRDVMARDFVTVEMPDELAAVARIAAAGFQTVFPVVEDGHVVGTVDDAELIRAIESFGPDAPVRAAHLVDALLVSPNDLLGDVLSRWQSGDASCVVAIDGGSIAGICPAAILGEHLAIHASLSRPRTAPFRKTQGPMAAK